MAVVNGPVVYSDTGQSVTPDQRATYRQLQAAGGIDPKAQPGSPRLPRAMRQDSTMGDVAPGEFFVDTQGRVQQASPATLEAYNASQINGGVRAFARGAPIIGQLADEGDAAINATISPVVEPMLRDAPKWAQHLVGYDPRLEVGNSPSWKDRYDQSLNLQHYSDINFDQQHPTASPVLQTAGGVAGVVAAPVSTPFSAGLKAESGIVQRGLAGAADGAIYGGTHGYGAGSGGAVDPSRLTGAQNEGALGALGGGTLPAAMQLGGNIARPIVGKVADTVMPKVTVGAPADEPLLAAMAGRGPKVSVMGADSPRPNPTRPMYPATRDGLPEDLSGSTNALVDALAAIDASPSFAVSRTDANAAYDRVLRALMRQDTPPEQAVQTAQGLGTFGTLADSGDGTRELLRAAMNTPSKAGSVGRDVLDLRQKGVLENGDFKVRPSSGRIADYAASGLGTAGRAYHSEADALIANQKAASAEAYAKAYAAEPVSATELAPFAASDLWSKAYGRARGISQKEFIAQPDGSEKIVPLPEQPPAQMDWRTLDLMKQAMDDLVKEGRVQGIGANEQAALKGYRERYVKRLDELNADYKPARDAFGGPAKSLEAMDAGRSFLKEDAEVTAKDLTAMPPGDQLMFRVGVLQALKDKLGNTPVTYDAAANAGLLKPAQLEKFKAVFPSQEAYADFVNKLQNEQTMFQTRAAAMGNSTTAKQLAAMQDAGTDPLAQAVAQTVSGNALGAAKSAYDAVMKWGGEGKLNEDTANAIASILLSMDKRAYPAILKGLSDAEKRKILADTLRQGGTTAAGSGAASQFGDK